MVAKIHSCFLLNIVKIYPLYLSKVKKTHFISNLKIPVNHTGDDGVSRHLYLHLGLLVFSFLIFTTHNSSGLISSAQVGTHVISTAFIPLPIMVSYPDNCSGHKEEQHSISQSHVLLVTRVPERTFLGVAIQYFSLFVLPG